MQRDRHYVRVMVQVDWSAPGHYDPRAVPCTLCGLPTNTRTAADEPAHQACFESALERELVDQAHVRLTAERYPAAVLAGVAA